MTTKKVDIISKNMENIEEKLKNLGLNEKESRVYLAILRLKKATVIRISRETGVKRTTVYHCLDTLIEKGLVIKVVRDEQKHYVAEDPKESLGNIVEERRRMVDMISPELSSIFGRDTVFPEVKSYTKIFGLKKIFEDLLNCQEKVARYYASDFSIEDLFGEEFVDDFVKKRIKKKINSKALRSFEYKPEREKGEVHAHQLREVRFLPENVKIGPYMVIYDNKVVVISAKTEKLGFVIQSKEFAEAQKAIFDMLWNNVAI